MTINPVTSLPARIALMWIITVALYCAMSWGRIALQLASDPDDQMRLLQVQDFLRGQSWFDVTQYRLGLAGEPPGGFAMHWSRFVDLPIAAIILLLRPILGAQMADMAALIIVPMLTMGMIMALTAILIRRVQGEAATTFAMLFLLWCPAVMTQVQPLRIDHHGWQIVTALGAMLAITGEHQLRSGWIAGLCASLLLNISIEGLPFTLALLGLVGLHWLIDPRQARRLRGCVMGLGFGSVGLFATTHLPATWAQTYCDAVGVHTLAALACGAVGVWIATILPAQARAAQVAALGATGAAAIAVYLGAAPQCMAGPFNALDPLLRTLWLANINEVRPFWEQTPALATMAIATPIVGIIGSYIGVRESEGQVRTAWLYLLGFAILTLPVSAMVLRASATANIAALPGATLLIYRLLLRARQIPLVPLRLAATIGVFTLATPMVVMNTLIDAVPPAYGSVRQRDLPSAERWCVNGSVVAALARLPRSTIFTPLDMGPSVLVRTPHRAVASGYHRNASAMHDVMAAFTGSPEAARATAAKYGARYIALCPSMAEVGIYKRHAPGGFAARLTKGERYSWLTPVDVGDARIAVFEITMPRRPAVVPSQ